MKLVATIDCTAERSRVQWTAHMPFRCSFMNNTPHSQTSVKDWEGENSHLLSSKLLVKGRIMCSMCIKKKSRFNILLLKSRRLLIKHEPGEKSTYCHREMGQVVSADKNKIVLM